MKCVAVMIASAVLAGAALQDSTESRVTSRVLEAEGDELVLLQELTVDAPISKLWEAYTSSEGWTAWAAPKAEVDLRVGGTVRTQYDLNAELGAQGTNTLHILNYVPLRVLTLQAELSDSWPESLREDAERFSNVILFEELGEGRSRVLSYGIGYREVPEHRKLLEYFMPANEGLLQGLRTYLEKGERKNFGR